MKTRQQTQTRSFSTHLGHLQYIGWCDLVVHVSRGELIFAFYPNTAIVA